MNLTEWMTEVRRLVAALSPGHEGHNGAPIAVTFHPAEGRGHGALANWTASCGLRTSCGKTPEAATTALLDDLRGEIARTVGEHRATIARLEAAAKGLRLVGKRAT